MKATNYNLQYAEPDNVHEHVLKCIQLSLSLSYGWLLDAKDLLGYYCRNVEFDPRGIGINRWRVAF